MKRISTLIIGAGQAGLAMSKCLSDRSIPHVVIERGDVANAWRTQRWDSLRLLTPNWQSRLPGFAYSGSDPDGFMGMPELIEYLESYAAVSCAPIEPRTSVVSVTADVAGYRVLTTRGEWQCQNLILANGACSRAHVPGFSGAVPEHVEQLTPLQYRNPSQLPDGGVLVVGASATGVQLAAEIATAGHEVVLSAAEHIRMPRHYRGRDIQWWMDRCGVLDTRTQEVDDINRARRVPSLQLFGDSTRRFADLNALQASGVEIAGRLATIRDGQALFSGGLSNAATLSDLKMNRLLAQFDAWAQERATPGLGTPERFDPTSLPSSPRLTCNLTESNIRSIIWATGFRPDFSWLHLPVFDRRGRLLHQEGRVAHGLYVLGLPFLRRRKSTLLDGVGDDARAHADHLTQVIGSRAA